MIGSVNEITNLAAKAARGAGAPQAQAEAFGRAAARHLAEGRDTDELAAALAALPGGIILEMPLALMRVAEDRLTQARIAAGALPDLACSYAQSQGFACAVRREGADLVLSPQYDQPPPVLRMARLSLPGPLVDEMQQLAARLLVPETEASRLRGAGAGLTDND
jgi:hypothetical protein